eukprot:TRINITY_DN1403_c0_g1_i1.p1 TRINITY_DN1403_c0_g1~~TRINITY_DN1403_c0_g1_i1.p1  ORF type:complete len:205 (-),score=63.38 TRINITY_DN1403_c0_g1_i1:43-630(-)
MEFFEGDPASLSKEEGRIFKHTEGKGPVEVPVFAKTESKQFPVLKEVSAGVYSFVQKSWDKGGGQGYRITSVLQIVPTKDHVNDFEGRRTELERELRGEKLQTIPTLFYAPSQQVLHVTLRDGIGKAIQERTGTSFALDPAVAIREGSSQTNEVLMCRICLGKEGIDYHFINGKYVLKNSRQAMPAFLIGYERDQ